MLVLFKIVNRRYCSVSYVNGVEGECLMIIGYIRTDGTEADLNEQAAIMDSVSPEKLFIDRNTAMYGSRHQMEAALGMAGHGDVFVVTCLQRFARNTANFLEMMNRLAEQGTDFVSIAEGFDTRLDNAHMLMPVLVSLNKVERSFVEYRRAAGMRRVRKQGEPFCRPRLQVDEDVFCQEYSLWQNGEQSAQDAANHLKISIATFFRRVKEFRQTGAISNTNPPAVKRGN